MPDNLQRGMKWIRTDKRLAVYLRDGMRCVWCGHQGTDLGYGLTLDHIAPGNDPTCMVTACNECNGRRGARALTPEEQRVAESHRHLPIDRAAGRHLLAVRKSLPAHMRPRWRK